MNSKVAVITGGSRGLGADMAKRLGKMGYKAVVNYAGSAEKAEAVVQEIKDSYGVDAFAIQGDISSYEDCQRMADATLERFGRVDVLINNAGVASGSLFLDKKPEDYYRLIGVNLLGMMNMCHVFMPLLIKQDESCVINMSSTGARIPSPLQSDYGASKAGIISFSHTMALDLAPYNCRVNCIAPGTIMTELMKGAKVEGAERVLRREIPMKRIGEVKDVSDGMEYLINAKYVTGFTLEINGGLHMN